MNPAYFIFGICLLFLLIAGGVKVAVLRGVRKFNRDEEKE